MPNDFDLGTWLGRRQAFGIMSGKASAADAECLRQIRDQKLYKARTSNWSQFCTRYLGASKAHVNRIIQYLEEFGPDFFTMTQLTRIPPELYRGIAAQVSNAGLLHKGELIPFAPEHTERLSAVVAELRRQAEPEPVKKAAPRPKDSTRILSGLNAVLQSLESLDEPLDVEQKISLAAAVVHLEDAAQELGVVFRLV